MRMISRNQNQGVGLSNSRQALERKLLRNKIRRKRSLIFLIWALAFAYLSYTSAEVKSSSPTKNSADNIDIQPQLSNRFSSIEWRSNDNHGVNNGVNYNLVLGLGEPGLDDFHNLGAGVPGDSMGQNCTPPAIDDFPSDLFTQSERQSGAVAIHFLVSVYIFYTIAIVCDDYFVPSIECICEELSLSSDIAGASFMAIATSSPELFTNVIGTFITEGDIGIGTIVGSAVFNILAIAACCGFAAKSALQLEWWPLTRDCFFYSVSVILLILVIVNRKVFWYEALILVSFYLVYIGVMYKNAWFKKAAENLVFGRGARRKVSRRSSHSHKDDTERTPLIDGTNEKPTVVSFSEPRKDEDGEEDVELSFEERDELLIAKALHESEVHAEEEKEEFGICKFPRGESVLIWIEWIVGWPIRVVLTFTIPDCREKRFRSWYPVTFLMCIVWIASLSYVVSWMMTIIGHTLGIPDSVMGLTFIAAGTSVPEAVSSVIVARQGLGAMGISNSIGSNTFDILICLGLPWLIRAGLAASSEVNYVLVNSSGFEYSVIQLMASLFVIYILLACNRFVLDKKVSCIALALYAAFLVLSSLIELNVFFTVNLPTCES